LFDETGAGSSSPDTKKAFLVKGARLGYIRVSSFDQNEHRQLDGVQVDRTFTDKASGKDINRPKLEEMLAFAREGDTIVVHSMDRLARNLDDLRRLVQGLASTLEVALQGGFAIFTLACRSCSAGVGLTSGVAADLLSIRYRRGGPGAPKMGQPSL